jgi:hypothetical protein
MPAVPARPDTISSAKLNRPKPHDPAELNERLGRNKNIEHVLKEMSGMGGNTPIEFHDTYAIYKGLESLGLDVSAEITILEQKARISGDEGGKNKLQAVQLLEDKPVLFPGAGTMYPTPEPTPGLIERGWNAITGKRSG